MRTHPQPGQGVYSHVTQQIVAAIEQGAGTWCCPWHHDGSSITRPTNVLSTKAYRGVNRLALWAAAKSAGYGSGLWGTYRAWAAAEAQVRKGEKATTVVLWKEARPAKDDDAKEAEDQTGRVRMFAKSFFVFNLAQVDNYTPEPAARLPESARLAQAEAFLAALRIPTTEGAFDAHYRINLDRIFMPTFAVFDDAASHIATLAHEAAHASGAKHRLDRELTGRFGSAAYCAEELVAELTASFILADLGIAHQPRPDHAAYLAHWLEVLKADARAILTVAAKAQQAADWMWAQQPREAGAGTG
jgi:antirestriction protein ArdC